MGCYVTKKRTTKTQDAPLVPELEQGKRFLAELAPGTDKFTFQTFDDDGDRKNRKLARVLNGTLAEHADELVRLNAAGAGIFVTVNETDLKGRTANNIAAVRAAFVDLDGAPLHPLLAAQPQAHIVVESSSQRYHGYWRTEGVALETFRDLQLMLIAHFHSDPQVHDLPRVMRLPGFVHHKVKDGVASPPFRTRIVTANANPFVTADALRAMCKVTVLKGLAEEDAGKGVDELVDEDDPVVSAAFANLKAWVPELFPNAVFYPGTGAWRISSKDLGRDLEEDLSIHPEGIKDFGVADQGDATEGGRTPVDLVIEYGKQPDEAAAITWLRQRLGLPSPQPTNTKPAEGGQQTNISRTILRIATSLWGAGTCVEQGRWEFDNGNKVVELRKGGNDQWFDFTARKSGNAHALMRLAEPTSTVTLEATPFTLRDHRTITPRDWVYDEHYIKGFLSATVAPGGGGKTSLELVEAVALASGRNLLGPRVTKKYRVWYWNGEEPLVELERRIAAICLHYNITQAELAGYLFLNSGRDPNSKITIAEATNSGPLSDRMSPNNKTIPGSNGNGPHHSHLRALAIWVISG
jgi:hypothetical protein